MLYVTTRNNRDAYTAQRSLCEKRGSDGGLYVPFREPRFSAAEIDALAGKSFNQCVAELLNILFNTRLTSWDVDFCAGRYPVRLVKINQRILMGECWHNPEWKFHRMVQSLAELMRSDKDADALPGDWAEVGVRIAVLFGICGELMRSGIVSREKPFDVSVVSGDFSAPMSAWYARKWGLPIGNIVLCCNENNSMWDLLHQGQLRTDGVSVETATPEADIVVPDGLERLVYGCGGYLEVQRFLEVCRRGGTYYPNEGVLAALRKGMYVGVVSQRRMRTTIPSVYGTNSYLLSPCGSLAYAGLLDYRARTGESRYALVLSEKSPACDLNTVADALGISPEELKQHIAKH